MATRVPHRCEQRRCITASIRHFQKHACIFVVWIGYEDAIGAFAYPGPVTLVRRFLSFAEESVNSPLYTLRRHSPGMISQVR